jgi:hypothetical protein
LPFSLWQYLSFRREAINILRGSVAKERWAGSHGSGLCVILDSGKWLHPGGNTHFPWGELASNARTAESICIEDVSLISCKLQGCQFYKAFSCLSHQTTGSSILNTSGQKQIANDDSSGSNLFLKDVLDPVQSSQQKKERSSVTQEGLKRGEQLCHLPPDSTFYLSFLLLLEMSLEHALPKPSAGPWYQKSTFL